MTGYLGRADDGPRVQDLTPESLRTLLLEATASVEIDVADPGSDVGARANRTDGEAWRVEIRGVGPDRLRTTAANTEATFDLLRSWAADDGWWLEAFSWEPAGDEAH